MFDFERSPFPVWEISWRGIRTEVERPFVFIVMVQKAMMVTCPPVASKLIEIEGSETYLGGRIYNLMGRMSESDARVSRLGGSREGAPWPWGFQRQKRFQERNAGRSVLEMLFVSYPSEDTGKELTVIWAWNTAEKSKLDIFVNAY